MKKILISIVFIVCLTGGVFGWVKFTGRNRTLKYGNRPEGVHFVESYCIYGYVIVAVGGVDNPKIIQLFEKYLDFTSMDINIKGCSEYNEFHKSVSKLVVYQQAVYLCQDYLYDHPNDFNVEEIQDQMNIFYKEMTDLTNYIITNCE